MQEPPDNSEQTAAYQQSQSDDHLPDKTDRNYPNIPSYEIQERVGTGGFGCVYRAHRKTDRAVVAIKMLRPRGPLTDAVRTRFLREATLLCQLEHPNIITFRELGIAGDELYLVMDYVESIAWSDFRKSLSPRKNQRLVFATIDRCLDALTYLHGKGMVHRDLKPNNLLFERRKQKLHVFLADFGLAKDYLQAGNSGVTSDNEIAGTLSYLAPELLAGVKYFLPASDQYGLAATCYDMLSGRPPIEFKSAVSVLTLIRNHQVPRIESLVPDIPRALADWIHQGLHTDPSQRFSSTLEMHQVLQDALAIKGST